MPMNKGSELLKVKLILSPVKIYQKWVPLWKLNVRALETLKYVTMEIHDKK